MFFLLAGFFLSRWESTDFVTYDFLVLFVSFTVKYF